MSDGDSQQEEALAAFCQREYPRLVGALSLYCGDADVAEELPQGPKGRGRHQRLIRPWTRTNFGGSP